MSLPIYKDHETISVTPIRDTKYQIIWLNKIENNTQKAFFLDTSETTRKLRKPEDIHDDIRNREDVMNMLESPEKALIELMRMAEEEITNESTPPSPMPLPIDSEIRVNLEKEKNVDQNTIGSLIEALSKMQTTTKPNMLPFEIISDKIQQTQNLLRYLEQYNREMAIKNINDPKLKKEMLMLCLGPTAVRQIDDLDEVTAVTGPNAIYENYIIQTKKALTLEGLELQARTHMTSMEQYEGEGTLGYFHRLNEAAEASNFETKKIKDERILEQWVAKSTDKEFRRKCIVQNADLKEALKIAQSLTTTRAIEQKLTKDQNKIYFNYRGRERADYRQQGYNSNPNWQGGRERNPNFRSDFSRNSNPDTRRQDFSYTRRTGQGTSYSRGNPYTRQISGGRRCKYCLTVHGPGRCPAFYRECSVCHIKGHFWQSEVCEKKRDASRGNGVFRTNERGQSPTPGIRYLTNVEANERNYTEIHNDEENEEIITNELYLNDASVRQIRRTDALF